jgi:hypothetical protein
VDPALVESLEPPRGMFNPEAEAHSWYIDYFARTGNTFSRQTVFFIVTSPVVGIIGKLYL